MCGLILGARDRATLLTDYAHTTIILIILIVLWFVVSLTL